jgi:hypothetical protein
MLKTRRLRRAGHSARMVNTDEYRLLVGKPGGTRPLGRSIRRCVDNIKIDLGEMG